MYTYVLLYMCNMYIFIYKWEHLYVYIYICVCIRLSYKSFPTSPRVTCLRSSLAALQLEPQLPEPGLPARSPSELVITDNSNKKNNNKNDKKRHSDKKLNKSSSK